MIRTGKRMLAVIMAVLTVVFATGCGGPQVGAVSGIAGKLTDYLYPSNYEQDTNYVFVMSPRANSADPDESFLGEYAEEAAKYGINVSVVSVEGNPRVVNSHPVEKRKEGLSEVAQKKIIKRQAAEILTWISESKAETGEADLFKAFTLAGREAGKGGAKHSKIIVSDCGISTAGLMIFNTPALDGRLSGDEIARNLKEKDVLPDLSDVEIIWQGVADCKTPQMELYENNRNNIKAIWMEVLEECGASVSFDMTVSHAVTDSSLYPDVTTVVATSPGDAMEMEGITDFSELCRFRPGSPELLTGEAEVLKQLGKYIDYMNTHPDYRLLIVGTTASADTEAVLASLSKARCETIRTLLVKAGADPARIETAGLGYETTRFCIKDTDENGRFVEELGQKNRRVLLMNADHEEADNVRALAVS